MSHESDFIEDKDFRNMTQCKCGHIFYSGLWDCPMCKIDKEEDELIEPKRG